jgi:hypothetical protein
MPVLHKNKTFATLLAAVLGGIGVHRFYLRGINDRWGWLHASAIIVCGIINGAAPGVDPFYKLLPLFLSILIACLEALVLGLMPDEKWDAAFNAGSGRQSASRWPLACVLVATLMLGAFALIATISRLFDLMLTGGVYG